MRVSFPGPPAGPMGSYLGRVFQELQRALGFAVSSNEAAHRIILRSPDGTNYEVTVSDAGVLTTSVI